MAEHTITAVRLSLAQTALFEITKISEVLREYVAKHDDTGEIVPIARGMLARVQTLSEAVHACVSGAEGVDDRNDRQLTEAVLCGIE